MAAVTPAPGARATVLVVVGMVLIAWTLSGCARSGSADDDGGSGSLGTTSEDGWLRGSRASSADGPSQRTFVVSPGGDDAGAGTEAEPWRSLGAALPRLQPGDTLLVRRGRYRERLAQVDINPARPEAPIRVQAWPGDAPVLQGLLWLRDADYWTISGLHITWDPADDQDEHMMKMTDGEGWSLSGNELSGARSYAALLVAGEGDRPTGWRVTNNCIHDTFPSNDVNQDHLIYVNTGIHAGRGLIARNMLFGASNGSGIKLGGARKGSGTANVAVLRNTIVDTAQSVLVAWESRGNRIEGNLLYGVGEGYANVRGYQLDGRDNRVAANAGGGAASLVLNDRGHRGMVDAGDNVFPLEPQFRSVGCDGFEPEDRDAQRYGARSRSST